MKILFFLIGIALAAELHPPSLPASRSNACFMNAALQLLFSIPTVRDAVLEPSNFPPLTNFLMNNMDEFKKQEMIAQQAIKEISELHNSLVEAKDKHPAMKKARMQMMKMLTEEERIETIKKAEEFADNDVTIVRIKHRIDDLMIKASLSMEFVKKFKRNQVLLILQMIFIAMELQLSNNLHDIKGFSLMFITLWATDDPVAISIKSCLESIETFVILDFDPLSESILANRISTIQTAVHSLIPKLQDMMLNKFILSGLSASDSSYFLSFLLDSFQEISALSDIRNAFIAGADPLLLPDDVTKMMKISELLKTSIESPFLYISYIDCSFAIESVIKTSSFVYHLMAMMIHSTTEPIATLYKTTDPDLPWMLCKDDFVTKISEETMLKINGRAVFFLYIRQDYLLEFYRIDSWISIVTDIEFLSAHDSDLAKARLSVLPKKVIPRTERILEETIIDWSKVYETIKPVEIPAPQLIPRPKRIKKPRSNK